MSKHRVPRKFWTPEEDAIFRDLYPSRAPMAELCARFGRGPDILWRRAKKLGLSRPAGMRGLGGGPRGLKPGYLWWTPEDDALLRQLFPIDTTPAELVARIKHPINSIHKRARQLGLRRPPRRAGLGARTLLALELGARPQGVGSDDMAPAIAAANAASTFLCRLVRNGMLFAVSGAKGRGSWSRYFATAEAAARFVPPTALPKAPPMKKTGGGRAGWEADAPMHITPQTIYTIAPPPPAMVWRTNTHAR